MGTNASRGEAISSYYPEFDGPSGIKVYRDNLKAQQLSGTIISAGVVYGISHQLGKLPGTVIVSPSLTKAEASDESSAVVALVDRASATTSAKFYVCGNKAGARFRAFLLA